MASILRSASRSVLKQNTGASLRVQRRTILTLKETKYTATSTASGAGRNGNVTSDDGTAHPLDLKLAMPKDLGGSGAGVNPEQLFSAGYSACFLGALQAVANQQGKKELVKDASVTAAVSIGPPTDKPGFGISVDIKVSGVSDQALIEAAHAFCPYSRALSHGAEVTVSSA